MSPVDPFLPTFTTGFGLTLGLVMGHDDGRARSGIAAPADKVKLQTNVLHWVCRASRL
ncbi:hypothetical protein ACSFA8_18720 [Variovorax sp. RT4R15]|uniref:hypothetical protein n=1 Tax=Variovorax sp. RT4R15 TaxID=3443737 RepID=UPI003F451EFA